jgi:hypothetical protein
MRATLVFVSFLVGASVVIVGTAVGCSSSSNKGAATADGGGGDECAEIDSQCGQPCDLGNSLGVGQFCNQITQCENTSQAHLCSSLGSLTTHFCTFRCSAADAGPPEGGDGGLAFPTSCGEGATCTCDNSGNCGCTPTSCL